MSGSKSYGQRGAHSKLVDSVFSKKPSTDPYLFESDEDGGSPVKATQPARKKPRVGLRECMSSYTCVVYVGFYNLLAYMLFNKKLYMLFSR